MNYKMSNLTSSRKSKEDEEKSSPPELPEHIIFDILTRIPSRLLVKNFKTVCKKWLAFFSDSQFIIQNFRRNKSELLIIIPYYNKGPFFKIRSLVMDEKQLDYQFNYHHTPQIPRTVSGNPRLGRIASSFNGVLLVNNTKEDGWLYVFNLLTKSSIILPPCPSGCPHTICSSALGFDPRTKQYKVVHIYADSFGIELFTVGSSNNDWEVLPGPFQSDDRPYDIFSNFRLKDPLLIDGQYLHWYVDSNRYIISMDVGEEKIIRTYLPNGGFGMKKRAYSLTELGGKLSCIVNVSRTEMDIWVMNNFHDQVWIKKHSIVAQGVHYTDVEGCCKRLPIMNKLIAVATLRDGGVIIFKHKQEKGFMYLYDMKSRQMKQFKMQMKKGQKFIPHRSSLMYWVTAEELLPFNLAIN